MKTTKLVVGIIMIVLSVVIFVQSTIVGVGNTLSSNHQSGGTAGILLSLLFLAAGIIYICLRNHSGMGGDIANLIILVIASFMGFAAGSFSDLRIWASLALIIGLLFFIWHLIVNQHSKKHAQHSASNPLPAAANRPSTPSTREAR